MSESFLSASLLRSPAGADQPAPIPNPESLRLPAEYTFVLCQHTSDNADAIADALVGCDIIALEAIGETSESRQKKNGSYTRYCAADAAESEIDETDEYFDQLYLYFENRFNHRQADNILLYHALLKRFKGTGKKIYLIDIDNDHPAHEPTNQFGQTDLDAAFEDALSTTGGVDMARAALADTIIGLGLGSRDREQVAIDQLKQLGRNRPGSNIGVMTGMFHTGIQHTLARHARTARVFIPEEVEPAGTGRIVFDPGLALARSIRFGKISEIPPSDLNRELLRKYYERYIVMHEQIMRYCTSFMHEDAAYEPESFPEAAFIEDLSDEYASELLGEIDRALQAFYHPYAGAQAAEAIRGVFADAAKWIEEIQDGSIAGVRISAAKPDATQG